nr:hypothetical protein [Herpetosiphonaceae bacterium]
YPSVQPVADWVDLDLSYLYDELDRPTAAAAVREIGHARAWMVRWSAWDRPDSWQVDLGPAGEVLAYNRAIPEDAAGATLALPAAQSLAAAALEQQVDLAQYALLDAGSVQRTDRTDHTFTWQTRQTVVGEAYQRVDVVVQGDQVAAITPSLYTPPIYRRERDQITFAESFVNKIPAALASWPALILPLVGLIGVLRRQVAVRPWAWLGLAGGVIWLLLGIGRLTHGQLAEGPRLIQGLSWALMDGVLNGGELALLGAGAATAWRLGTQSDQRGAAGIGLSVRSRLADALQLGWLLAPFLLLFVLARAWPGAKPGLFAPAGALGALLPALDSLGRAMLSATTTTLILAGVFGMLKALFSRWRLGGLDPTLAALLLTSLGMLLAAINLREPAQIGLALLAWPLATWLGAQTRGNLLAIWWALVVLRVLPAGLGLVGTAGPLWYALNGGLLLVGLGMSAGWATGRLIETRAQG